MTWQEAIYGNSSIAFVRLNATSLVGSTTIFTGPTGFSYRPFILTFPTDGHYLVFFESVSSGVRHPTSSSPFNSSPHPHSPTTQHRQIYSTQLKVGSGGPPRRRAAADSWADQPAAPVAYTLVASIQEVNNSNNATSTAQSYFPRASVFNNTLALVVWEVVGTYFSLSFSLALLITLLLLGTDGHTDVLARTTSASGASPGSLVDLGAGAKIAQFPDVSLRDTHFNSYTLTHRSPL